MARLTLEEEESYPTHEMCRGMNQQKGGMHKEFRRLAARQASCVMALSISNY